MKVAQPRILSELDIDRKLTPKPTGPGIVSVTVPRPSDKSSPADARRHADGKVHKNKYAKPTQSTLANEPNEGQKRVPSRVKMAPGVPNDKNIKRGYYPPDADISKKNVGNETYT